MEGGAGPVEYTLNGTSRLMPYLLVDGIYPSWQVFVKGFTAPITEKQKLFAAMVARVRKDIERAYGLIKKRFPILKSGFNMRNIQDIAMFVKCLICLHNMIIDDEREIVNFEDRLYWLNDEERVAFAAEQEVFIVEDQNAQAQFANYLNNLAVAMNNEEHVSLRNDFMEHIWEMRHTVCY